MKAKDLEYLRRVGALWERNFCTIARALGRGATLHQEDKTSAARVELPISGHLILPDVTLWWPTEEWHEIKHRAPTRTGYFGCDAYRFDDFVEFARKANKRIFLTIHDHSRCGGVNSRLNRIEDWVTANVLELAEQITITSKGPALVGGQERTVDIHYWSYCSFRRLSDHFGVRPSLLANALDSSSSYPRAA